MNLDNLYQEVILDHYKNPLNKSLAKEYDVQVHHINPSCGDEITLNITLTGNTISKITWDGVGCSISQASVSIASDLLVGKTLDVSESITEEFMDLMQSKGKKSGNELVLEDAVALLGWMAIKDAAIQASSK
jgi:nitrogen fixation NifU-like protein